MGRRLVLLMVSNHGEISCIDTSFDVLEKAAVVLCDW